jgi:hypothetical protein
MAAPSCERDRPFARTVRQVQEPRQTLRRALVAATQPVQGLRHDCRDGRP